MKKSGFTLIELVVVIVILGLLAVTAAPRFLNLQDDARTSALEGLKGAMAGASGVVYGKASVNGQDSSSVVVDTEGVLTVWGYPTAEGIDEAVVDLVNDWATATSNATGIPGDGSHQLLATFVGDNLSDSESIVATNCYVSYSEATSQAEPNILVVATGC